MAAKKKRYNPYNEGIAASRAYALDKPRRDSTLAAQRDSAHLDTMQRMTDNLHAKVADEKAKRVKVKKPAPKTKYGAAGNVWSLMNRGNQ